MNAPAHEQSLFPGLPPPADPVAFDAAAALAALVDGGHLAAMSRAEAAVYLVLCRRADSRAAVAVAHAALAADAGIAAAASVRAALRGLQDRGLLRVESQGGGRSHRSTYLIQTTPTHVDTGSVDKRVPQRTRLEKGVRRRCPLQKGVRQRTPLTAEPADDAGAAGDLQQSSTPAASRKSRHDVLSEAKPYRLFTDFWLAKKRAENPAYKFLSEDGVHLAAVWKRAAENLLLAQNAVIEFMADSFFEGHPAKAFHGQIERYLTRAANPGNAKPRAGERSQDRISRLLEQRLAKQGGGSAEAGAGDVGGDPYAIPTRRRVLDGREPLKEEIA